MRLLFEIDKQDYIPGGTVGRRPSVRGIIVRQGKIAMIRSLRDDYCKLPGGGIDGDETHAETLIREVHEESGLRVIPESIREWGFVRRIQKGWHEDIFIQENYYYFCDAEDTADAQSLDAYEAAAQFTPEWVTPAQAIAVNERARSSTNSDRHRSVMIERENRVLRLLSEEYPALFTEGDGGTVKQISGTATHSGNGFRPLTVSIIATVCALLLPLACGLSCLLFGFDSPTDGGSVSGTDAFAVGLLLGMLFAGPAAVVSLISLAMSLRDRREAVQKPAVKSLSLIALGITLFFLYEACRISG